MDMAIRKSSQGKQTLDDFMRYMYEKYYKQLDRGFKDEEFKKEAIKFAPALDGFFEKYVWGTETIPYNDFFSRSEEHTSELQYLMRISYTVFCLTKKT